MIRYLATVLVLCTLVSGALGVAYGKSASAQAGSRASGKSAAESRKIPEGTPDDGKVANGVYSEAFFNLRYSMPQGWSIRTEEMRKAAGQADDSALLLLSAFEGAAPQPGKVNSSVTITAERAEQNQDAAAYVEELATFGGNRGFKVLNEASSLDIGGVTFVREDLVKEEADGNTYQASMVTLRKGWVLSITAISGDEEQLTPLLNRMQIFAPPTLKRK